MSTPTRPPAVKVPHVFTIPEGVERAVCLCGHVCDLPRIIHTCVIVPTSCSACNRLPVNGYGTEWSWRKVFEVHQSLIHAKKPAAKKAVAL